jgi:hypothetical protein
MEPAQSIVKRLGGPTAIAKALRISASGVSRWSIASPKGCGGLIPSRHIPDLCALARKQNIFLEPNMFFKGHMAP